MKLENVLDVGEFKSALSAAETDYEIFHILKEITQRFAFRYFSVLRLPRSKHYTFSEISVVSSLPPDIIVEIDSRDIVGKSRGISRALTTTEPIFWDMESRLAEHVASGRSGLDALMDLFAQHGVTVGFDVPVHTYSGRRGLIILFGDRAKLSDAETGTLVLISNMIFERLTSIQRSAIREVNLTEREKDCLHWTAAGKTSAEIAIILELSEHTVNHYLGTACQKLNAQNRTHAVSLALRNGLIE